jgi:hypothetical protein
MRLRALTNPSSFKGTSLSRLALAKEEKLFGIFWASSTHRCFQILWYENEHTRHFDAEVFWQGGGGFRQWHMHVVSLAGSRLGIVTTCINVTSKVSSVCAEYT